uniref:Uncharacterized protein n=1 Tax=Romanomermis culicivorax TaxID=13658 RepID=A0A915K3A1_ROMCU
MPALNKFVSFQQPQTTPLLQPQPRTKILLEQLIQRWDLNCEECQSRHCPEEYQSNAQNQPPRQQFQPPDI